MAGIFLIKTPDISEPPPPPPPPPASKLNDRWAKINCNDYKNGPKDGPEAKQRLEMCIQYRITNEFNDLEIDIYNWNGKGGTKEICVFDDGRPCISAISGGYSHLLNTNYNKSWEVNLDLIKKLRSKHPKSVSIALFESEYWINYAWNARGHGLSSTVTKDGYRLFNERMQIAEKVLLESKSYASSLPLWYSQMIEVQNNLNRNPVEIDKTFIEGATKHKLYYPIYFTMLNYNLPTWGGSWGTVENLVNWSVNKTHDTEGYSMYARMYWNVYDGLQEGTKLFEDTYAVWPKMKRGFEDLMQKHPKSNWNLNNFAKFACLANDKETFLALRKQIGANIHGAAWGNDASLDLCDHKMEYINE
jgi:hypothetical protein